MNLIFLYLKSILSILNQMYILLYIYIYFFIVLRLSQLRPGNGHHSLCRYQNTKYHAPTTLTQCGLATGGQLVFTISQVRVNGWMNNKKGSDVEEIALENAEPPTTLRSVATVIASSCNQSGAPIHDKINKYDKL